MGACLGCCEGCFLHCMKRCGCCICDCCYGVSKKAYCSYHEDGDGKTLFNSPFSLILYDKWCKESDIYQQKEQLFQELSISIMKKNISQDLIILDIGCGTGAFVEILCQTFMKNNNDTLICTDTSPQSLHFVRTRIVEKSTNLRNRHIEYFNNEPNKLCLESKYDENDIDIIFMSFVMNHISAKTGDRHSILKELYKSCKNGGAFVVIEYGKDLLKQFDIDINTNNDNNDDGQELLKNVQNDSVPQYFTSCDALQQYIETFGFKMERRIMKDTFDEKQWVLLFRKPN